MITVSNRDTVELSWQSGDDRVARNVRNLIMMWTGEAAFARNMGLDSRLIDRPANEAIPLLQANVRSQIETYEPQANVVDVRVRREKNGLFYIEVDLEVEE